MESVPIGVRRYRFERPCFGLDPEDPDYDRLKQQQRN
jgi:hypothetical protein